jgi:hypothetical protein
MTCGDAIEVFAPTLLEGTKLNEFVAHDVGVGSETFAHRLDGIGNHIIPVLLVKIDLFKSATILASNIGGDFNILLGRSVDIALFVFHADADIEDGGVVALLFKQVHDNGTVDAS